MAQSIVGTSLATNAAAIDRVPCYELLVAWGLDADDAVTWATDGFDESARILNVTWQRDLNMDSALGIGRGSAATMTVTLDNRDQRYSPYNETSPLNTTYQVLTRSTTTPGGEGVVYPKLFMVPVRLRFGFENSGTPEYVTVFIGYIDQVDETYGVSGGTVTLRCLDRGSKLLQHKASTAMHTDQRTDAWISLLANNLGTIAPVTTKVDAGLFIVPYCWLDDENLWTELQQAAAAEGGYAYFDEVGDFNFHNALWWVTATDSTVSVLTFTVNKFTEITPGYDWKDVATGAIVEYQPRWGGGEQVLWERKQTITVPPGGTTIEVKYRYPCTSAYAPVRDVDWLPVNAGGIVFDNDEVQASLQNQYAQRCTLTFSNSTIETAFVDKIKIRGVAIVGGPNEEVERTVTSPLVPENKVRITSNPYIQTKSQAELIADLTGDRMQYPRLVYRLAGVKAVPWLQLGDMITITAAEPITNSRTAIVTALSFSWAPESRFAMTVTAVDRAGLYPYSSFFVIGTSALDDTDVVIYR